MAGFEIDTKPINPGLFFDFQVKFIGLLKVNCRIS
jgi:hypothetical protein